ncbi:hypothetical protein ACFZAR_34955 [Streptomyces sp. NPDC008222]|uniref:hypothetical protein n=1 Tax=Streptomyces sp. NPDC008222 TaxID=3364820 RepID=UPI0036DFEEE6
MKKLTTRIAAAASCAAVAGIAVLGAGGTASAAAPVSAHVHRPAAGAKADYRWDHGVGYLIEQGCSWDDIRGRHRDHRVTDSTRHGRDGRFYRWDGKGCCDWKSGSSYRHDRNRYEHDGRIHGDR